MKRTMHRTIDKIAQKVREMGSLNRVQFCNELDLSPATFYNYKDFVVDRYTDIIFENGVLKTIPVEDVNP